MNETIKYGIDLGTTNSAIAKCDGDDIRIFKNRDQMEVTPSVVRIEKTGRIIVGRRAYQLLLTDPDNVASEFKRLMGQNDFKLFSAVSKKLSPEELSAEVLKSLIDDVRLQTSENVDAAVITVPAAFGQLQCEATARAALLAGLLEAPLLQEPLAASIAYGMKSDTRDKRWLVYDLGGGTFDIAVVSTKDGRLSVLEHRGDNMLGGKDFDRLIVERIILPRLEKSFNLSSLNDSVTSNRRLIQILRGKAEEVKIDLSRADRVLISIFDCGEDKDGKPIEAEFEITSPEFNRLIEPTIAKTIDLCKQALTQARLTPADIATVILVGGPTNTPFIREMLSTELDVPLDYSVDPLTIVARGAAIYASTQPLKKCASKAVKQETIELTLAYEPVWSEITCLVAGKINDLKTEIGSVEIRIDAESGHWTSGWIPVTNGYFETKVHLLESKTVRYWVYMRDTNGKDLPIIPDSFFIRHGLTLSEPPLPHSIGAEIVGSDGKREIDIIFPRSTPLPAEKRVVYKASRTLNPGQTDDCLAIKIWEGESLSDPEANTWVGALRIDAKEITRPIPEGGNIEILISIDASRLMKVEAFVSVLNQHFQKRVYIPKENEESINEKALHLDAELYEHYERIHEFENVAHDTGDIDIRQKVDDAKVKLDELAEEQKRLKINTKSDPDDSKRIVQQSKKIRGCLSELEKQVKSKATLPLLMSRLETARSQAEDVVNRWGQNLEKKEYEILHREAERQAGREDVKALEKVINDFEGLKWRILFKQNWFWKECFDSLCKLGGSFVNMKEAQRLISLGREAIQQGDGEALKGIVRCLWDLQPKSFVESEKEIALEVGIKRKL